MAALILSKINKNVVIIVAQETKESSSVRQI